MGRCRHGHIWQCVTMPYIYTVVQNRYAVTVVFNIDFRCGKGMSDRSIQNIFKSYETHLALSRQPLKNRKAIHAITHCRTKEMGSSYYSCPDRHEAIEVCHSCRNRSCYVCAQKTKLEWIEKQKSESIEFSYLDHRDKRVKRLRLTPEAFLSHVLTHAPSIGQHTVRYYGVYAASSKAKCRESMPRQVGSSSSVGQPFKSLLFYCKVGGGERKKENSFINGVLPGIFAQQIDEADKFNVAASRGP